MLEAEGLDVKQRLTFTQQSELAVVGQEAMDLCCM